MLEGVVILILLDLAVNEPIQGLKVLLILSSRPGVVLGSFVVFTDHSLLETVLAKVGWVVWLESKG